MRFVIGLVALLVLAPANPIKAAENPGSSTSSSATEALYLACLKEARALQNRYTGCETKECRDQVTKDFDAWSAKCFKE